MRQYLDLLREIRETGIDKSDRTGTGTRSLFGGQMSFDLEEGFPLVTTKKLHTKSIIYELLWMIKGETNVKWLQEHRVTIWDEWADEQGELGPVYGRQWRAWQAYTPVPDVFPTMYVPRTIDQLKEVLESIKKDPDSRRHLVMAWNPADADAMALPPCHMMFQFYVAQGTLSCHMYQRSADFFLGVPFNIASYALLTMMVAQVSGLRPKHFIHSFGDRHIYRNHFEQVDTQLTRTPLPLPRMKLNPDVTDLFAFRYEDFALEGYTAHAHIAAPVAK